MFNKPKISKFMNHNKYTDSALEKIIGYYGTTHQFFKAVEENTELSLAVINFILDPSEKNRNNIQEEIADVLIMIQQLMIILDFDKIDCIEAVFFKLNRTLQSINNDNQKTKHASRKASSDIRSKKKKVR